MTIILILISLVLAGCGSGIGKQAEPAMTPPAGTGSPAVAESPANSVFEPAEGVAVFESNEETLAKAGHKITFYGSDGAVWKQIDARDDSLESLKGEEGDFFPLLFSNGASTEFAIELRITGRSDDWLRVVVHETREPQTVAYLRADDPMFKPLSWEQYALSFFNLRFDPDSNPVLQMPDGSPTDARMPEEPLIKPDEVRGDWLKIRWTTHEPDEPSAGEIAKQFPGNVGWIRWRKDGEILIHEYYP